MSKAQTPIAPSMTLALPERSTFLLPALTLWSSIVIYLISRKRNLGIITSLDRLDNKPAVAIIGIALLGVFTLFVVGHILDLLSSLVFERFLSDKLHGFPHERVVPPSHTTGRYLLFIQKKRTDMRRVSFFYEGAKLLVISTSLLVFGQIIIRHPEVIDLPSLHKFVEYSNLYFGICSLIALLFALPAALVRYAPVGTGSGRRRIAARLLRRARRALKSGPAWKHIGKCGHIFVILSVGPLVYAYDLTDRLVRGLFRLNKEIDSNTFDAIVSTAKARLKLDWTALKNNDRFWLLYLYLYSIKSDMLKPIQSIRTASAFCRNQSLACMLSAMILAGAYRTGQDVSLNVLSMTDMMNLSISLFLVGWLFHWKFLQQYYAFTKMTFRSFAILGMPDIKPSKNKPPPIGTSNEKLSRNSDA